MNFTHTQRELNKQSHIFIGFVLHENWTFWQKRKTIREFYTHNNLDLKQRTGATKYRKKRKPWILLLPSIQMNRKQNMGDENELNGKEYIDWRG